jgi:hypothetical protein
MAVGEIKNKIGIFLIKTLYKIEIWIIKRLLNKCHVFIYVAISHARIIASHLFESNTVGENIDIAIAAVYKLSNIETSALKGEINFEQVEALVLKLNSDKDVMNLLAEYNLATSYAYARASLTDTKHYVDEYISKAKVFSADVEPFSPKSFNERLKLVKSKKKYLQKQLNQILNNKIAKEKQGDIGEISLNSADIAIFFSLFSSLFVISGYYYNYSLLKEFNVNSDHFYVVSDYISTSISLIITILFWTGLFIVSFILGASDRLDKIIRENQLNKKVKDKPLIALPLFIISMNIINLFSMLEGRFERVDTIMALNVLVVSFYLIEKMPFHYFKHPIKIYGSILVCLGFIWNLNVKVNEEIQNITSDDYQPKYLVKFNDEMVEGMPLEFIALNSNYLIMRNTDSKSIEIYPKSYIKKLTPNPNQAHELNFIEWGVAFIDIYSQLYEVITKETDEKVSEGNL